MENNKLYEVCKGFTSKWKIAYKSIYTITTIIVAIAGILSINEMLKPDSFLYKCKDDTARNNALRATRGFQIASQIYTIFAIVLIVGTDIAYYFFFKQNPYPDYNTLFSFAEKLFIGNFVMISLWSIVLFILLMISKISSEKCK